VESNNDRSNRHESPDALTLLLHQLNLGNAAAFQELIPIAYQGIKRLAVIHISADDPAHTLQPTALVHQVYLRLEGCTRLVIRPLYGSSAFRP
jgi:hypothetical protein